MPLIGTEIDINSLSEFFLDNKFHHAYVEKVHALPGTGAKSTFSFGFGCGILETLLTVRGIPFTYVRPKQWQKWAHKNIDKGNKAKEKSIIAAIQRFPEADFKLGKRSYHDGVIDAALICEYGIKGIGGE